MIGYLATWDETSKDAFIGKELKVLAGKRQKIPLLDYIQPILLRVQQPRTQRPN
jgi:hypothetical protein